MYSYTPDANPLIAMFAAALTVAEQRSRTFAATVRVNATLGMDGTDNPVIKGFDVSDWFDGATVATYTNGRRD